MPITKSLGKKGVMQVGALILTLVTSMVVVFIALLLGGVLTAQISEQFTAFNVSSVWVNLFNTTQNIATSAISIAIIGFLIGAFMVILYMLGGFGGSRER